LNDVIYCVFAQTFFSALKSLDGNAAMLIILRRCRIIKCYYYYYYYMIYVVAVNTDTYVYD